MRWILALALATTATFQSQICWAQGPTTLEQLDASQIQLFDLLQEDDPENATAWSQKLGRSNLLELLRVGPLADRKELEAIRAKFRGDAPELKTEPFVKVRDALEAHIAKLQESQTRAAKLIESLPEFERFDQAKWLAEQQLSLDRAVKRVDAYLKNSGKKNANDWKEFFEWDDLITSIEGLRNATRLDAETGRNYMQLQEVLQNFYGYTKGLGSPPFVALREEIAEYLEVFLLTKSPEKSIPPEVQRRLKGLQNSLVAYEYDYDPTARARIGDYLGWLERARQAKRLVRSLRGRYWHPNVYVEVSEAFAGSGINDAINDVSPVRDQLMGTNITGTAHTTGEYFLGFSPSSSGVAMSICVDALARAQTVGQRGKVRVHSSGNTMIKASKALFFTEGGKLMSAGTADAKCVTNSQITGVSHKSRLVRRIAYNKAIQYKPMGEQYANDKGEEQAIAQLEKQAAPILKQANDSFRSKVRQPLIGMELYPRWLNLSSTFDAIAGRFVVTDATQLAAPNLPPQMPSQKFAATIQVHESALTNIADNLIRGFVLDNDNIIEILKELKREVPKELLAGEEWSMKFADNNSVVIRFNDNLIQLGFRGEEFTQGDGNVIQTEIEFLAKYQVEIQPRGIVLKRVGEVEGNVIAERARLDDVAIMSVVVKKFNAVFAPEIVVESRKLPKPYDKAGDILPKYFYCGHGWASAAIDAENVRQQTVRQ